MYDWASQAFATVVQTFVFATYFTDTIASSPETGAAWWGWALGLAGLMVALVGPMLGAVADQQGRRKPRIALFTLLCVLAMGGLWFVQPGPGGDGFWLGLALVMVGTMGSEFATIFYNAMLPTLVPPPRIGRWSGWAWGLGYAGGLVCLGLALALVTWGGGLGLNHWPAGPVRASFLLAAGWYGLFAWPLLRWTPDAPATGKPWGAAVRDGMRQLGRSLGHVRRYAPLARFLLARMIYIDGLATLFAFGGVYAAGTFGMTTEEVLLFGIALNITAGGGAVAMAWVDDWVGPRPTILLSLIGLILPVAGMLMTGSVVVFWSLGLVLGLFVGPVQAASRSYLARTAPADLRNEAFGLYALSGKATAFLGPVLVGAVSYAASSQRVGMTVIPVLFSVGFALMWTVPRARSA